MKKEKEKRRRK